MKKIYILGGGTFNDVNNDVSLSKISFGKTAKEIKSKLELELIHQNLFKEYGVELILTKMADSEKSEIITNKDVVDLIDKLIVDKNTKAIVFDISLTNYEGKLNNTESKNVTMELSQSNEIIGKIRKERKDIFVVGVSNTENYTSNMQYIKGLEFLKKNSLNLVLAKDQKTQNNMIVAPEETRYSETKDKSYVISNLVKIIVSRMKNTFTRSTVIEGQSVNWESKVIPSNLREVVDYCIENGAYKEFLGKTAGHFAVKLNDSEILTSIRKSNFNNLKEVGLVKVESKNKDEVIAHGFRPSVGGQSQRIIFSEHPELDCIVHFHCPVKSEFKETKIPVKEQWPNECGSHECGKNTSNGLKKIDLGDGDYVKVVYLDEHGPNIVFNKKTNSKKVISFINEHFDLSSKTGGLVELH